RQRGHGPRPLRPPCRRAGRRRRHPAGPGHDHLPLPRHRRRHRAHRRVRPAPAVVPGDGDPKRAGLSGPASHPTLPPRGHPMRANRMKTFAGTVVALGILLPGVLWLAGPVAGEPGKKGPFNVEVPKVSTDPTIKYDYDIVYVRTPRKGNAPHSSRWPDASLPLNVDAGGDLMLLHPDGSEERLVAGGNCSVTDPFVSFDGQW